MGVVSWITVGLIIGYVSLYLFSCYLEFKDWNYGICKESGQPWTSFSVDSSGAIGYSDDFGHTIWISYSTVRLANYIKNEESK